MQHTHDVPTGQRRVAVVIEDDQDIRDLILAVFEKSGFTVDSAADGDAGIELVRHCDPVVVTLDLGLPGIDGFEVARHIRSFSDCYIIMVSAQTDEAEILMGLTAGADDFITKPFRPRELRARIDAMLRRPRSAAPKIQTEGLPAEADQPAAVPEPVTGKPAAEKSGVLNHNGLVLDPATRSVRLNAESLSLTRTEFDLLATLMHSGRRVRTKAALVRHLRLEDSDADSYVSDADERAVEVHIGNLRRKLGQNGNVPGWVETVRGVGYRMTGES